MLTWIKKISKPPVPEKDEDALTASLQHMMLLIFAAAGFFVPLLLNFTALLDPSDDTTFEFSTLLMGLIIPVIALGLIELMHRGYLRLASIIITGILFLLTTSTVITFRGTRDSATSMYVLIIVMAGLLLGGRGALVFMLLSLLATFGVYWAEVNGLLVITLTETPGIVEWLILAVVLFLIGILLSFARDTLTNAIRAARIANEELEGMQSSLTERVAARTKDLELAAEIGRQLSQVQGSEEILLEAVEMIQLRFNLYYTQIYLVDEVRNNLVLRAGTGLVGRQLRQLGHRLPISGSSINGTAVIKKQPVIVSDTIESAIFRQNPLLPETRSEMAVPLIASEHVVGVLNLQSAIPNSLTEENLSAFEALAGQLAISLVNARLFSEAVEAQSVVESLVHRLTRTGWDAYLNAIDRQESIRFTYDLTKSGFVEVPLETDSKSSFSVPISLGGADLGKIEIQGNEWDTWNQEDQELVTAVGERVAQQIENLRLLAETERYRTETEEANRQLVREGWQTYTDDQMGQSDGYLYDLNQIVPIPSNGSSPKKESNLVKPLTVRGQTVGQFEIDGLSEVDEETAALVEAVADRLSAHIENLRLSNQTESALRSTEKRAEELAVINELARTVSQQLDIEQMLEAVYEQVRRVISADAFIIGLYDHETNLIRYPLMYDEGVRYQEGVHYLAKDTRIYQVLMKGETLTVNYQSEAELPSGEILQKNALGNESKASRSMMFIPLIFGNTTVGVISVHSYQFNAYSEADLALIEGIASHLSVAIQNSQLFEQTQSALAETEVQAARLSLLTELGQALTEARTLEEVYQVTADLAHHIVDSDRTSITMLSEDGQYYDIIALGGEKSESKVGERQPLEDSNIGQASKENRLITVNNSEDTGIAGIYSYMVAPLVTSDKVIGTINVGSKSKTVYGPREEGLLRQIASLLATTVESRRLFTQTQQRVEELAVVNRIARTISQELEVDQMLDTILAEVSRILAVDVFIVGLYDETSNLLQYPLVYDDGKRYKLNNDGPGENSVVDQVLHDHQPQLILRSEAEVAERTNNIRSTMIGDESKVSASLMYVPLFLGQRSTGIVSVQSYQFNAYKPEDVTLLGGISNHIAVALENAQLFQQTQDALSQTEKQAHRLSLLNEIGAMLSSSTSEEEVFQIVGKQTKGLIQNDRVSMSLLSEDGQWLDLYPLDGMEINYPSGTRFPVEGTSLGLAIQEQRIVDEKNLAESQLSDSKLLNELGLGSTLVAPLIASGQAIGTFNVVSKTANAFDVTDTNILRQIAALIASTLESRRLFSQTEQRAGELSVINQVALVVSQLLELKDLYSAVHEQIQRAIVSDAFFVAIYNEEENSINFPYLFDDGDHYIIDPIPASSDLEVVQVIQTGQPIWVNFGDQEESEKDTPYKALLATEKAPTSMIFVPLRAGLKPVGAISVQNYQSHNYTQADVDLLSGIAYHLAVALENARLFSETEKRAEELAVLNQIAQAVSGQTEQKELLRTVYGQIQRLMPVDAFSVTSYDPKTQMIQYLMVMDEGQEFEESPTSLGKGSVSQVIRSGKPILTNRTVAELDELAREQSATLIGNVQRYSASMIYVPLRIGSEIIGGLSIQSYELNVYSQAEVDLLVGIANHVAVALENTRLFEETENTLAETELLYNIGIQINQAITLNDLANVVGIPGLANGADSAGLFRFELDENGQAEWMELAANWSGTGSTVLPVGTRLHLPDIPLAAAEIYTPNEPYLIGNIDEDERVNDEARQLLQGLNIKAMAIIPMQQLDSWIGTLIIRWQEPYAFGPQEHRLYNSLARQMGTALSNQILLSETQERASQLEKINQVETALSQAQDEEAILEALAGLLDENQMASIHYVADEDAPTTAYTVAHWENSQIQKSDKFLFNPFDLELHAGFNLGLKQPDRISFISDVQSDDRVTKTAAKEAKKVHFRSIMVVPLRSAGRWQGFVSIKGPGTHEFSANEIAIWDKLRESLAAIIASRRAYLAQQDALSETAVLYETGAQLSVARSFDEVLAVLRNNTVLGQNITNVGIMLFEHNWEPDNIPAYADVLTFWSEIAPDQTKLRFHYKDYPSSEKILGEGTKPRMFTNVADSTELDENLKRMLIKGFNTNTFVLFPMVVRGNWIGYVNAMYPEPTTFSEKDIRRTEAIIQQAGVAIQGLRNLEQAEQQALVARSRSNELAILNEMGRSLTALVDMDTILENVYRYTARLMDATNFYISFYDGKRNEITFALDIRGERVMKNVGTRQAANGLTEHIIHTKEPILIPDNVDRKLKQLGIELIGPASASWLGVPLMVGSQVIGVIGLQHWDVPRTYNEQHLRLLTSVAAQAAIAIENARLFEQIQARARRERILREVTAKVRSATDADTVMRTAVSEIGRALGRRTFVYLNETDSPDPKAKKEDAYGD